MPPSHTAPCQEERAAKAALLKQERAELATIARNAAANKEQSPLHSASTMAAYTAMVHAAAPSPPASGGQSGPSGEQAAAMDATGME